MTKCLQRKTRKIAVPANPAIVYRGHGWAGWARLLGAEGGGKIDDNIRSVYLALIPALDKSEERGPAWTGLCLELEVADDEGNKIEGERISKMQDHSREWHTLIVREALAATEADENLWWERQIILETLDKIGWTDQNNRRPKHE